MIVCRFLSVVFVLTIAGLNACAVERFEAPAEDGDPSETDPASPVPTLANPDAGQAQGPATDGPIDVGPEVEPGGPGDTSETDPDVEPSPTATPPIGTDPRTDPDPPSPSDEPDPTSPLPSGDSGTGPTPPGAPDAGPPREAGSEGVATPDASRGPPDECPDHPDQLERGSCGCGFAPDESCTALAQTLAHRYSFDGHGALAVDSAAGADGNIIDAELDGSGSLELDGESTYVELPAGMISVFSQATFDIWLRWDGGQSNQRIFNFGTVGSTGGVPSTYVSLSPRTNNDELTLAIRSSNDSGQSLSAGQALPTESVQHVTVVIDGVADELLLYVNGELVEAEGTSHHLMDLEDSINWLGRALYADYPFYDGAIDEFRIHDAVLTEDQVRTSERLGPDAQFADD